MPRELFSVGKSPFSGGFMVKFALDAGAHAVRLMKPPDFWRFQVRKMSVPTLICGMSVKKYYFKNKHAS